MCGIFGAIGSGFNVEKIKILTLANEERGKHAVGFFDGTNLIKKACEPSVIVKSAKLFWEQLKDKPYVMGHTRQATHGSKDLSKNAHPFMSGNIVGTHNGIIRNYIDLKKELAVDFDVDSEYIFYLINKEEYIDTALKQLEGYWGLSFTDLLNPDIIYLTRKDQTISIVQDNNGVIYYSSSGEHLKLIAQDNAKIELIEENVLYSINHITKEITKDKINYPVKTYSYTNTNTRNYSHYGYGGYDYDDSYYERGYENSLPFTKKKEDTSTYKDSFCKECNKFLKDTDKGVSTFSVELRKDVVYCEDCYKKIFKVKDTSAESEKIVSQFQSGLCTRCGLKTETKGARKFVNETKEWLCESCHAKYLKSKEQYHYDIRCCQCNEVLLQSEVEQNYIGNMEDFMCNTCLEKFAKTSPKDVCTFCNSKIFKDEDKFETNKGLVYHKECYEALNKEVRKEL